MWIHIVAGLACAAMAQAPPPCTDTDGKKPLATGFGCKDKWPAATCKAIFGDPVKPADTDRTTNNAKCLDPALVKMASENCSLTCAYCCESPEYKCDNKPYTKSGINCTNMADKCEDKNWKQIISEYCPSTCGMCLDGGCIDIATGCTQDMCWNINLIPFAHEKCARTCDKCPPKATPTTTAPPAAGNTPATAKTPAPNTGNCVDLDVINCPHWKRNGKFCNNSWYKDDWYKCRKSCGRC